MKRYRIPYPNVTSLLRKSKRKHSQKQTGCISTQVQEDFADDESSDIDEETLRKPRIDNQHLTMVHHDSFSTTKTFSSCVSPASCDKLPTNAEQLDHQIHQNNWDNEQEESRHSGVEELCSADSDDSSIIGCDFSDAHFSDVESEASEMPGSLNEPLTSALELKKIDALYMVLYYFTRHNLTIEALVDLLKLINSIIGFKCLPETYYAFSQVFSSGVYSKHYVCSNCFYYFEHKTQELNACPCCDGRNREFFISFCLKDQLRTMISRYHNEIAQFKNVSRNNEFLKDIHDGSVLKTNQSEYFLSVTFATDGVATAASNMKTSMWPISLTLNDLHMSKRFTRKNTLLSGLWLSKGSPHMAPFLRAFTSQMHELFTEGIRVDGTTYKFTVAACVADIPGKNKLLNMVQFNGRFGCSYCLHTGTLIHNNQIRYSHKNSKLYDMRKHDDQVFYMQHASSSNEIVKGVKGYSPLIALDGFDVVKQMPIDYMHNALLGVTKSLLNLWTDSEHHKQPWYLAGQRAKNILKKRFNRIYSYSEISRSPRDVFNTAKLKANELQNWLLYFSLPCLNGVLNREYLKHFALFRGSISKLLCSNIDLSALHLIEKDLKEFVFRYEMLYGTKYMTINVHLLLHLVEQVENLGPLWTVSMFPFEDFNGYLKKMIKGPKSPIIQIARKYILTQQCHFSNKSRISPIAVEYYEKIFQSTPPANWKLDQHEGKSIKLYNHFGVKYRPLSKNKKRCDDSLISIFIEELEYFAVIQDIRTSAYKDTFFFMLDIMEAYELDYNFYRLEPSTCKISVKVTNETKIIKCVRFDTGPIFCSKIINIGFKD